jgi:lipopolysaccharide biosynthesis regulator YciM
VLLRILLFIVIILFSLLGYITYLNHEISVTLFLIPKKPLTIVLPALIIVSFAAGAAIVFLAGLIRDVVEGWRRLRRDRRAKQEEALQSEMAKGLSFLLEGNGERARVHLTNALNRDPENLDIHAKLSDIDAAQGKLKEAAEILEKAWTIDPQSKEILLKKANLYDQMGNPVMAAAVLEKVLAMDPNNVVALSALRDVHLQQENWEKTLTIQKSIADTTQNTATGSQERRFYMGLKYEYAQSLTHEGNRESLEKALRLCKEIIRTDKEFQPAYVLLGDVYQKQRRWVEAGRVLGRGFHLYRSAVFLLRLEDLYLRRDDQKTLLKIYRRTMENNPDNAVIPLLYSRLCLKLNMLDEAMDELVEMSKKRDDGATLHGLMAEVLAQKGQLEAAVREYKKTSELAGFLRLSFICHSCQRESPEWVARCPSCRHWNTYSLVGEDQSERTMQS